MRLMPVKRALLLLIGAAVALVVLVLATPVGRVFVEQVVEALYPASISWDGKSAFARCRSAIAKRTSWPQTPQSACAAMHMCVNEAVLSGDEQRVLYDMIRKTPGCEDP